MFFSTANQCLSVGLPMFENRNLGYVNNYARCYLTCGIYIYIYMYMCAYMWFRFARNRSNWSDQICSDADRCATCWMYHRDCMIKRNQLNVISQTVYVYISWRPRLGNAWSICFGSVCSTRLSFVSKFSYFGDDQQSIVQVLRLLMLMLTVEYWINNSWFGSRKFLHKVWRTTGVDAAWIWRIVQLNAVTCN